MSSLSQALRLGDLPPPHRTFQGHATHIIEWSMMLRPNDSWSTCILQGIATFLHYASRRSAGGRYTAGFSIPCPGMPLTSILDVQCLNEHLDLLSTVSQVNLGQEGLIIPCEPGVRSAVRYLVVHFGNGLELFALVHHTYTIDNRARSDRQAQFREAFATISSDNPDLVRLMGIIERIIFDDEAIRIARQSRQGRPSAEPKDEGSQALGPFAVRPDDTNKQRSNTYRRLVEAGDLGHILDVLIHHLGV